MRFNVCTIALSSILALGVTPGISAHAQDSGAPTPQEQSGQPMHQGGMHGPMSPDMELTHLTKMLNLSSDQQSQIKPILQDRHDQMMQLHQDQSLARPDKMAKMKSLDEDSNTKLEAVLNEKQKTKYEKMIEQRKEKMQQMRSMRQSGEPPPPEGNGTQPQ